MEAALISYYTEISDNGQFLPRSKYQIDWQRMIEVSRTHGYISSNEITLGDTMTRITLWSNEDSYDKWLRDDYVQQYITQRNNHNNSHHIKYYTTLVLL